MNACVAVVGRSDWRYVRLHSWRRYLSGANKVSRIYEWYKDTHCRRSSADCAYASKSGGSAWSSTQELQCSGLLGE